MRIASLATMAITIAASAPPRALADPVVTVYVRDNASVPLGQISRAQKLAKDMFAAIGVRIEWRLGQPSISSPGGSIAIELVDQTPASLMPGALAYAKPYEGIHIQIFYDRIQRGPYQTERLAHVLVHEITHILQGIVRHSDSGVMKAKWTWEDERQMLDHLLSFTEADINLIHHGLLASHPLLLNGEIPSSDGGFR